MGLKLGVLSFRGSRRGREMSGAEVRSLLLASPKRDLTLVGLEVVVVLLLVAWFAGGGGASGTALGWGVPKTAERKALRAKAAAGVSGASL